MSNAPAGRVDLVFKLLRFALDPSACEGEAINAAGQMVRAARRERVAIDHLVLALAPEPKRLAATPSHAPPACELEMPFGKHRGKPLGWIARHDLGYLEWLRENVELKHWLDEAIETVMDFMTKEAS